MTDFIILIILGVLILLGVRESIRHFKGQGSCCGGGGAPVKRQRKRLAQANIRKIVEVEGMTCDHCRNRVENSINALDGAAAKVSLKKKQAVISLEKDIPDEKIKAVIEEAGYQVQGIQTEKIG